ncbi:hypothetical protein CJF32_00009856 [Rutstroemia sp. NJR-2017a WRK4]|nr:hypothetical protein CJF32_00009856 [Rutstroemia sp. NJR-2017a WRK4]
MAQAALDNVQISERAEEEVPTSVDEDVPVNEEDVPVDEVDVPVNEEEVAADEGENAADDEEEGSDDEEEERSDEEEEGSDDEGGDDGAGEGEAGAGGGGDDEENSDEGSEEESSDREEDIDTNPTYINWPPPELVKNRWASGGHCRDAKDRWFGISIGRCEVSKVDPSMFISTITFSHEKFAYRATLGRERKKDPIVGHIRQPTVYRVWKDDLYVAIPSPIAKYIREKGRHGGVDHDVQLSSTSDPESQFKKMKSWWLFKYFETLGDTHNAPENFVFVPAHFDKCGLDKGATSGSIEDACISMTLVRHQEAESLNDADKDRTYIGVDRVTGIYSSDADTPKLFLHYLLDSWTKK